MVAARRVTRLSPVTRLGVTGVLFLAAKDAQPARQQQVDDHHRTDDRQANP